MGQGQPGMVFFFQTLGRLEPDKKWVSKVDWDHCSGDFWRRLGSYLVWQCNAGSLECLYNFLPFRRFCSIIYFFLLIFRACSKKY